MYEHILSYIASEPLLITSQKLSAIMQVLSSRQPLILPASLEQAPQVDAMRTQGVSTPRQSDFLISVINVHGSMTARSLPGVSGTTTYKNISNQLTLAENDSDIKVVVLDVDSHGGMHNGCERLVNRIRQTAQVKSVYAFIDTSAYSAAYWIIAACDEIILADKSCAVGNIGSRAVHVCVAEKNEKEGYVVTEKYFGGKKNDFSPNLSLTKNLENEMQAGVDKAGMEFAESIAKLRNMPLEKVLATEAGCYSGQGAIDAGLADSIMTWEELIENIQEKHTGGGTMPAMNTKQRLNAIITKNADAPDALAELGFVAAGAAIEASSAADEGAATEALASAKEEGYAAALDHVESVCNLAQLSGTGVEQISTLAKIKDLKTVGSTLQQQLADKSQAQQILSTVTPQTKDGKHRLVEMAEKRAAA